MSGGSDKCGKCSRERESNCHVLGSVPGSHGIYGKNRYDQELMYIALSYIAHCTSPANVQRYRLKCKSVIPNERMKLEC